MTTIEFRKAYWQHGVDLSKNTDSKGNHTGNCPFCGSLKKFSVNGEDGRYRCWKCGETGNLYTFLKRIYEEGKENTSSEDYKALKKLKPGLMWTVLKSLGYVLNPLTNRWSIPVFSRDGKSLLGLRYWCPVEKGHVSATYSTKAHFLGLDRLNPTGPIFIAEGDWDYPALHWLLEEGQYPKPWSVLGKPGAGVFPLDDLDWGGREVYLCDDNDLAGRQGLTIAGNKLTNSKSPPKSIKVVKWLKDLPEGYDLRDFCRDNAKTPKAGLQSLLNLCEDFATSGVKTIKRIRRESIEEVIEDFREAKILVDQSFADTLAICLATAFSVRIPGDPIWLLVVAPPSSGKTTLLESFLGTDQYCKAISKFTSQTLISGLRGPDGRDLSLLPELNGLVVVIKDYTTIKRLPATTQEELYGILRDIYDGHTCVIYGNGQRREFENINFSIIAGVTDIIHGDSRATLGERFLKVNLLGEHFDQEGLIRAAIRGNEDKASRTEAIQRSVLGFLDRSITQEDLPDLSGYHETRLAALAQIVAALRATVERGREGILYRPRAEIGGRLAVQLTRLAKCLCFVFRKETIDSEVFRLVQKVALDSATEFNLEVVQVLANSKVPLTADTIGEKLSLAGRTVRYKLDDLLELRVVTHDRSSNNRGIGRNVRLWSLSDRMRHLWDTAFMNSKEAKILRRKVVDL